MAKISHHKRLTIVPASADVGDDDGLDTAIELSASLISRLREVLDRSDQPVDHIACVLTTRPGEAHEPAVQAARSIVGALTLERGRRVRINLLVTHDESAGEVGETLELLDGDHGGFFAGSTFDLRRTA